MVILTAKLSKSKIAAIALIAIAAIAVLVVSVTGCTKKNSAQLTSNAERIAYLQSLGWEVSTEPVESQDVVIPSEMNGVLEKYNALQQNQGLDLTRYQGKTAKRFVYLVSNYAGAPSDVYATLITYKGRLIAADLSCTGDGGFVRGIGLQASGS